MMAFLIGLLAIICLFEATRRLFKAVMLNPFLLKNMQYLGEIRYRATYLYPTEEEYEARQQIPKADLVAANRLACQAVAFYVALVLLGCLASALM